VSNFLALATVTATLRDLLLTAMHDVVPGDLQVKTGRPESSATPFVGANLYLYEISPNVGLRNSDQPMRRSDGSLLQRPRVALDLSYLITFYGDESKLEPQRLMGSVVSMLHTNPVLTSTQIRATIESAANRYLANSDLDRQTESVKFTPVYLSLEEISKIWTVFFQVTHSLSIAYQASVVLLDSFAMPTKALPVRSLGGRVVPSDRPVIRDIEPRVLDYSPGASIAIEVDGADAGSTVLIGGIPVSPTLTAPGTLTAGLPGQIGAGLSGVSVVSAEGIESDQLAVVVRPRIAANADFFSRADPATGQPMAVIVLSLDPPLTSLQPAVLYLNNPQSLQAYSFADVCRWSLPDLLRPADTQTPVTAAMREFFQNRGVTLASGVETQAGSTPGTWIVAGDIPSRYFRIRSAADGLAVYYGLVPEDAENSIAFRAQGVATGGYLVRAQVDGLARAESSLISGKLLFEDAWSPPPGLTGSAVPPDLRAIFTSHSAPLSAQATFDAAGKGQWTIEQLSTPQSLLLRVTGVQLSVFDTTSPDGSYIGPMVTVP
jgi:hypothetical protein